MIKYFILSLILFSFTYGQSQIDKNKTRIDSIYNLINSSKNNKFDFEKRISYAKKSRVLAKQIKVDSLILLSQKALAVLYFDSGQYSKSKNLNRDNLNLSEKLNDSISTSAAMHNLAQIFHTEADNDSAYYYYSKTLKIYDELEITDKKAMVLMNISDIQETERDYIGSEENAIKAIKIYQNLPENENNLDNRWILNNLIGIISLKLKNYDKSLEYHDRALNISKKMVNGNYNKYLSINNMAFIYRKKNDYKKALELYQSLIPLRKEYEEYDPTFYPLIIDNIAFTKVLADHKDYNEISKMFYDAYELSEKLEDDITILAVTIDLAKYYRHLKIKDSTLKYSNKAYYLAKQISSNDILLESMILLSEIKEGNEGKKYLKEHIKLTDSLLQVERNVGNKFARIEFDTDQLEAENEQISKENLYLLILSIGLLFTAILIYVVISQRAKNRKLKLMQVQQKANEDIYNLMLGQQDKVDEARAKEKTRVSEELHDGVLGKLFGVRLSLDSINFNEGKEAMMTRAKYIAELQTVEQEIRKISHELNTDFVSGSGFLDIVTELIETQTQAYNLEHEFNYTDDISWDLVSNKTKINIYRIIQESMQNIYKHANAKAIKISISFEKSVICLDIIDDGDGFDTSKSKKGIGLKNMTSRVEDINGKITFTSQSGNGTEVNVKIPYTNQST